jgi:hypothetical protein
MIAALVVPHVHLVRELAIVEPRHSICRCLQFAVRRLGGILPIIDCSINSQVEHFLDIVEPWFDGFHS